MVNGDDVICEYETDKNSDWVTLKNPLQITMVPSRSGSQPNFGFIPYPLTSNDKEIKMKDSFIMFVCDPAEEFRTQYDSIFGSGIITPSKGIIV